MSNPLSPVSSDFNVFLRENPSVYFNSTTPAAPGGNTNVTFQFDQFGNVSAYTATGSSGITALTGDVTASGSGSVAATLATVNSNVGSFTNSNITVNGKGLVTAASSGIANIQITLPTSAISANTCTTPATASMPGLATTSALDTAFATNPNAVTGWGANGGLVFTAWPTANTLNWSVCNQTGLSITPGAMTINIGAK